jgi:hypothetical protein
MARDRLPKVADLILGHSCLTPVIVLSCTTSMADHLSSITSAFENVKKPPLFVSGTWTVPKDVLRLFFELKDAAQSVLSLSLLSLQ